MSKLDVVEIWKELHRMPEPGMNEFKTGEFLADALEKLGYEVTRGVGKTGVVGVVRGKEPGPVVMLRADMDALPFKNEDGSIEYVHACGHDSHSAMVLTAAAELVDKVKKGTLKILFQPAEETLEGALAVMKDGVIDDVDIALGLHVRPVQDIPAGTCCAAVRHSASTFLCVEIEGKSAHAARPHLGVNCAEAAALITNAICAIKMNPALTWSCKVTSISAVSSASNIIPDRGELVLDVRAQTNELMDELLEKVRRAIEGAASSIGAKATIKFPGGVIPAAIYDEDLVAEVAQTIKEELGADKLAPDCGGGGEDFHYFKQAKPNMKAAYFGLGAGCTPGLHARSFPKASKCSSRWRSRNWVDMPMPRRVSQKITRRFRPCSFSFAAAT